jgi:DNA-directed RNA polymerase specialized sigma24 family protein
MSSHGSVSHWIMALKDGESAAAQPLWERYYRQLIGLARKKLRTTSRRDADEDDIVQNAFHSFFRAVDQGRFPQLEDRDSLWRLLVTITANKALKRLAYAHRQKRGGGTEATPAGIYTLAATGEAALAEFVGDEPTPDFAVEVAEECGRLLDRLDDDTLRQVAVWKMEGYGNDEIAGKLSCSRRTVARKLDAIRILWSDEPAA